MRASGPARVVSESLGLVRPPSSPANSLWA